MGSKNKDAAADYERRHPKISFRVTPEELAQLQREARSADPPTNRSAIVHDRSVTRPSPDDGWKLDALVFLFKFFQGNAPNLVMTSDDKTRIQEIFKQVKVARQTS